MIQHYMTLGEGSGAEEKRGGGSVNDPTLHDTGGGGRGVY